MADNQSSKSPASTQHSSPSSDDDNILGLVDIEEHLPTFAKAAATHLPIITIEIEPPSFCLSQAT